MQNQANGKMRQKNSPWDSLFGTAKQIKDVRFGRIKVIWDEGKGVSVARKERIYQVESSYFNDLDVLQRRVALNHPNLIDVYDFSAGEKSEFCSSYFWIAIYFEFPNLDCRSATVKKRKLGVHFSDSELTHMLYGIVSAGAYLQKNGLVHGSIAPYNIAAISEEHYKLIDNFDYLNNPDKAQEALVMNGRTQYASPEKYRAIKSHLEFQDINRYKNDVFGLGLSMLEISNAKQMKRLYLQNGTFDEGGLNNQLDTLTATYKDKNNMLLLSTIESMTDPEVEDRPDFLQIESKLPEYEIVSSHLKSSASKFPPKFDVDNEMEKSIYNPNSRAASPMITPNKALLKQINNSPQETSPFEQERVIFSRSPPPPKKRRGDDQSKTPDKQNLAQQIANMFVESNKVDLGNGQNLATRSTAPTDKKDAEFENFISSKWVKTREMEIIRPTNSRSQSPMQIRARGENNAPFFAKNAATSKEYKHSRFTALKPSPQRPRVVNDYKRDSYNAFIDPNPRIVTRRAPPPSQLIGKMVNGKYIQIETPERKKSFKSATPKKRPRSTISNFESGVNRTSFAYQRPTFVDNPPIQAGSYIVGAEKRQFLR